MTDRPAAPLLENMGIVLDLEDNQQVTDVLLIARVADFEDGTTALVLGASTGVDWILQRGLLASAQDVMGHAESAD